MNKLNFYFNLSNGLLVKVSRFRFYLRLWFHFPVKGYRLIVLRQFDIYPTGLVLVWMPELESPNF